jgi:hypothetical protein
VTAGDLPESLAHRLVKLCGMLGSAHDGERAAAGLKADQLLRENGLRWPDVIGAPQRGSRLILLRTPVARAGRDRPARGGPLPADPSGCDRLEDQVLPKCRQAARPPDVQAT